MVSGIIELSLLYTPIAEYTNNKLNIIVIIHLIVRRCFHSSITKFNTRNRPQAIIKKIINRPWNSSAIPRAVNKEDVNDKIPATSIIKAYLNLIVYIRTMRNIN